MFYKGKRSCYAPVGSTATMPSEAVNLASTGKVVPTLVRVGTFQAALIQNRVLA